MTRTASTVLLTILFFAAGCYAEGGADQTLSPYFYVQGDPGVDLLPLKDTRVEIAVSGVIADVAVTQIYRNEGSRPIHARYVFPASTRAAVYGMRMKIGDQVIVAKVKERVQAKQEFENAKKEGKSASLLEEDRPNVFSMNVANILPGDTIEIELRYTELLVPSDNIYELVYPTVVGPRYSSQPEATAPQQDHWVKSPYLHQGEQATSDFHLSATVSAGLPIQQLACDTHKVRIEWKDPSTAQLTLDDSDAHQNNRDFILRYRLAGEQISSGILLYQGQDENFFLLMAQPPVRVADADIPNREYIFVVDVSGSMYGFPLDTAKGLLRDLIGGLRPSDLFNVVLFSGDARLLSERSLAATPENIEEAIRLIDAQRGGGGTELAQALQQAMDIPRAEQVSRTVVLVTDGYISAEKDVFDLIRDHLDSTNVFSFGIGSSVNRFLIEGVARAGMGEPFVLTGPQEAESVAAKVREYIRTPVLTNIRVNFPGLDVYDVEPARQPDLFAQRPIVVFGKYRGPMTGAFELEGMTGRGYFHAQLPAARIKPDESNRALRYLWARTRIADLSDFTSDGPGSDTAGVVTALGIRYNLLTKYTSFIAVREEVRNTQGDAQNVNQPLPLPSGVSDLAVAEGVSTGTEPGLLWLAVLVGLFFLYALRKTGVRRMCESGAQHGSRIQ